MEQFYKDDRVEVTAWLDGHVWCASVFIYYSDAHMNTLVIFPMPDTFKTYDGAIEACLAAAHKWTEGHKLTS